MSNEQARLELGRMAAKLAGLSNDDPRFEEVAAKAAKMKPDDFFELNGDEIEARFLFGEHDADAVAGKNAKLKRPLRKLAECLLSLADSRKLMIALVAVREMSAKRKSVRFDDAVCGLLKRWGGINVAVLDSLSCALVGKLCWRLCEEHSTEGDKSAIKTAQRGKDMARKKWQGKTWDQIADELGSNADAVKKAWHARQKRLNR
jgi:hypothetical protein